MPNDYRTVEHLEAIQKELALWRATLGPVQQILKEIRSRQLIRETAVHPLIHDGTATGKKKFQVFSELGGEYGNSYHIARLNGATITLSVNGHPFYPVGEGDAKSNMSIETLEIDVTAAGTGQVIILAGA